MSGSGAGRGETVVDVPFCGLPCAPLRMEAQGGGVRALEGGCPACRAAVEAHCLTGPPLVAGRPATLEAAVGRAAELLRAARRPLVYGLAASVVGTARLAADLAWRMRGALDIEGSTALQPGIEVVQSSGCSTATFGAIRSAADVVLLWRTDPRSTHPRLLGSGDATPAKRFIVVVEAGAVPSARAGEDLIVPVPRGGDLEAALVLRALVAGRMPRAGSVSKDTAAALETAAEALRAARYAAIVWSPEEAATAGAAATRARVAALQALAATLQEKARAAVVSLGAGGNVAGAMAALLSVCGLPRAVSFHDGTPRPAEALSGDALLLVGAQGADGGPAPIVHLGSRPPAGPDPPEVTIPTAIPALSEKGIWLRADGVPVTLAAPVASHLPREGDVLRALLARLEAAS